MTYEGIDKEHSSLRGNPVDLRPREQRISPVILRFNPLRGNPVDLQHKEKRQCKKH